MNTLKEVTLFKNHGKTVGDWTISAVVASTRELNPPAKLVISHTKVVGGKAVTSEVPVSGKNIGRANETSPAQQAVLELDSRVNKQLDKGYVRTLAEAAAPATNSLGLKKPMRAQPIDKVKPDSIDWDNAYAQPKLDGHRCLVNGIMYSRQGKEILLPHIRETLGDYGLLDKGLDGELYIHGMMLQDIGSLVKKPREESKQVQYHIYDLMRDAPYSERRAELFDLLDGACQGDSPLDFVVGHRIKNRDELDTLHRQFLSQGYEGSILRHGMAPYEDDKRSNSLLKVKDFSDGEFKVLGVERGTPNGSYEVPVWICSNPDGVDEDSKQFKVTAQGSMQEKHSQWLMKHTFVGRQLTVQHFGRSKNNVPLLPVALRWREDV